MWHPLKKSSYYYYCYYYYYYYYYYYHYYLVFYSPAKFKYHITPHKPGVSNSFSSPQTVLLVYIRGVKLIFAGGHISLEVAFKGPK